MNKPDEHDIASIPYFLYEDVACRFERSQKVLVIVTIVALILAIGLVVGMVLMTQVWSEAMHECDCAAKDVVRNLVNSRCL